MKHCLIVLFIYGLPNKRYNINATLPCMYLWRHGIPLSIISPILLNAFNYTFLVWAKLVKLSGSYLKTKYFLEKNINRIVQQNTFFYYHKFMCASMQVNVPNTCSYNIVTVKCGHCTMALSMDLSPFHQARIVPDNQVKDSFSNSHW